MTDPVDPKAAGIPPTADDPPGGPDDEPRAALAGADDEPSASGALAPVDTVEVDAEHPTAPNPSTALPPIARTPLAEPPPGSKGPADFLRKHEEKILSVSRNGIRYLLLFYGNEQGKLYFFRSEEDLRGNLQKFQAENEGKTPFPLQISVHQKTLEPEEGGGEGKKVLSEASIQINQLDKPGADPLVSFHLPEIKPHRDFPLQNAGFSVADLLLLVTKTPEGDKKEVVKHFAKVVELRKKQLPRDSTILPEEKDYLIKLVHSVSPDDAVTLLAALKPILKLCDHRGNYYGQFIAAAGQPPVKPIEKAAEILRERFVDIATWGISIEKDRPPWIHFLAKARIALLFSAYRSTVERLLGIDVYRGLMQSFVQAVVHHRPINENTNIAIDIMVSLTLDPEETAIDLIKQNLERNSWEIIEKTVHDSASELARWLILKFDKTLALAKGLEPPPAEEEYIPQSLRGSPDHAAAPTTLPISETPIPGVKIGNDVDISSPENPIREMIYEVIEANRQGAGTAILFSDRMLEFARRGDYEDDDTQALLRRHSELGSRPLVEYSLEFWMLNGQTLSAHLRIKYRTVEMEYPKVLAKFSTPTIEDEPRTALERAGFVAHDLLAMFTRFSKPDEKVKPITQLAQLAQTGFFNEAGERTFLVRLVSAVENPADYEPLFTALAELIELGAMADYVQEMGFPPQGSAIATAQRIVDSVRAVQKKKDVTNPLEEWGFSNLELAKIFEDVPEDQQVPLAQTIAKLMEEGFHTMLAAEVEGGEDLVETQRKALVDLLAETPPEQRLSSMRMVPAFTELRQGLSEWNFSYDDMIRLFDSILPEEQEEFGRALTALARTDFVEALEQGPFGIMGISDKQREAFVEFVSSIPHTDRAAVCEMLTAIALADAAQLYIQTTASSESEKIVKYLERFPDEDEWHDKVANRVNDIAAKILKTTKRNPLPKTDRPSEHLTPERLAKAQKIRRIALYARDREAIGKLVEASYIPVVTEYQRGLKVHKHAEEFIATLLHSPNNHESLIEILRKPNDRKLTKSIVARAHAFLEDLEDSKARAIRPVIDQVYIENRWDGILARLHEFNRLGESKDDLKKRWARVERWLEPGSFDHQAAIDSFDKVLAKKAKTFSDWAPAYQVLALLEISNEEIDKLIPGESPAHRKYDNTLNYNTPKRRLSNKWSNTSIPAGTTFLKLGAYGAVDIIDEDHQGRVIAFDDSPQTLLAQIAEAETRGDITPDRFSVILGKVTDPRPLGVFEDHSIDKIGIDGKLLKEEDQPFFRKLLTDALRVLVPNGQVIFKNVSNTADISIENARAELSRNQPIQLVASRHKSTITHIVTAIEPAQPEPTEPTEPEPAADELASPPLPLSPSPSLPRRSSKGAEAGPPASTVGAPLLPAVASAKEGAAPEDATPSIAELWAATLDRIASDVNTTVEAPREQWARIEKWLAEGSFDHAKAIESIDRVLDRRSETYGDWIAAYQVFVLLGVSDAEIGKWISNANDKYNRTLGLKPGGIIELASYAEDRLISLSDSPGTLLSKIDEYERDDEVTPERFRVALGKIDKNGFPVADHSINEIRIDAETLVDPTFGTFRYLAQESFRILTSKGRIILKSLNDETKKWSDKALKDFTRDGKTLLEKQEEGTTVTYIVRFPELEKADIIALLSPQESADTLINPRAPARELARTLLPHVRAKHAEEKKTDIIAVEDNPEDRRAIHRKTLAYVFVLKWKVKWGDPKKQTIAQLLQTDPSDTIIRFGGRITQTERDPNADKTVIKEKKKVLDSINKLLGQFDSMKLKLAEAINSKYEEGLKFIEEHLDLPEVEAASAALPGEPKPSAADLLQKARELLVKNTNEVITNLWSGKQVAVVNIATNEIHFFDTKKASRDFCIAMRKEHGVDNVFKFLLEIEKAEDDETEAVLLAKKLDASDRLFNVSPIEVARLPKIPDEFRNLIDQGHLTPLDFLFILHEMPEEVQSKFLSRLPHLFKIGIQGFIRDHKHLVIFLSSVKGNEALLFLQAVQALIEMEAIESYLRERRTPPTGDISSATGHTYNRTEVIISTTRSKYIDKDTAVPPVLLRLLRSTLLVGYDAQTVERLQSADLNRQAVDTWMAAHGYKEPLDDAAPVGTGQRPVRTGQRPVLVAKDFLSKLIRKVSDEELKAIVDPHRDGEKWKDIQKAIHTITRELANNGNNIWLTEQVEKLVGPYPEEPSTASDPSTSLRAGERPQRRSGSLTGNGDWRTHTLGGWKSQYGRLAQEGTPPPRPSTSSLRTQGSHGDSRLPAGQAGSPRPADVGAPPHGVIASPDVRRDEAIQRGTKPEARSRRQEARLSRAEAHRAKRAAEQAAAVERRQTKAEGQQAREDAARAEELSSLTARLGRWGFTIDDAAYLTEDIDRARKRSSLVQILVGVLETGFLDSITSPPPTRSAFVSLVADVSPNQRLAFAKHLQALAVGGFGGEAYGYLKGEDPANRTQRAALLLREKSEELLGEISTSATSWEPNKSIRVREMALLVRDQKALGNLLTAGLIATGCVIEDNRYDAQAVLFRIVQNPKQKFPPLEILTEIESINTRRDVAIAAKNFFHGLRNTPETQAIKEALDHAIQQAIPTEPGYPDPSTANAGQPPIVRLKYPKGLTHKSPPADVFQALRAEIDDHYWGDDAEAAVLIPDGVALFKNPDDAKRTAELSGLNYFLLDYTWKVTEEKKGIKVLVPGRGRRVVTLLAEDRPEEESVESPHKVLGRAWSTYFLAEEKRELTVKNGRREETIRMTETDEEKLRSQKLKPDKLIKLAQALFDYLNKHDPTRATDIVTTMNEHFGHRLNWDRRFQTFGDIDSEEFLAFNEEAAAVLRSGTPIYFVVTGGDKAITEDWAVQGKFKLQKKKPRDKSPFVELGWARKMIVAQNFGGTFGFVLKKVLEETGLAISPDALPRERIPPGRPTAKSLTPAQEHVIETLQAALTSYIDAHDKLSEDQAITLQIDTGIQTVSQEIARSTIKAVISGDKFLKKEFIPLAQGLSDHWEKGAPRLFEQLVTAMDMAYGDRFAWDNRLKVLKQLDRDGLIALSITPKVKISFQLGDPVYLYGKNMRFDILDTGFTTGGSGGYKLSTKHPKKKAYVELQLVDGEILITKDEGHNSLLLKNALIEGGLAKDKKDGGTEPAGSAPTPDIADLAKPPGRLPYSLSEQPQEIMRVGPGVRRQSRAGARHAVPNSLSLRGVKRRSNPVDSSGSPRPFGARDDSRGLGQVLARLFLAGRSDLKNELQAIEQELTAEQRRELTRANAATLVATAERVLAELSIKSPTHPLTHSPTHTVRAVDAVRNVRPAVFVGK